MSIIHVLGAQDVHLAYPNRMVFDSVTVGVAQGDRIGIVGRNGDGKSSLLRMLLGRLRPHGGRITHRGGLQVGMLEQTDDLDPTLSVSAAVVGDRPAHDWASQPRIRDVVDGLLGDIDWQATVSTLSGGQRRRVALAALLVGDADVIGLDEPTNHLDVEGISWLATHLARRWPAGSGALLVITHDRWFLDAVCNATWEVHDGIVEPFDGGYAAYVLQRLERDRISAATENKRQNLLRKELAWLRRGAPARTSKPKFRIEAANALIADVPPIRDRVELARMAIARLGKDVVDLDDVSVSYGCLPVLREVTWHIGPGERSGILGANGAGKSTLLSVIAGVLPPTVGRVKRGKTVQVAVLDQQCTQLEPHLGDRVREVLSQFRATFVVGGKEHTPAQLLERLGFSRADLSNRVGELSGGQRRRLQLLLVLLSEPNVLILDEPTNDVDTDMLAAMEDLLDSWPGTLLVVSHDRYLLERVTDQQYAILDGHLRHMPGGVDEYVRVRQAAGGSAAKSGAAAGASTGTSGAQRRAVQKEIAAVERRLGKLGVDIDRLHQRMADHEQGDYTGLQQLAGQLRAAEVDMADLEDRWLELSDQIE